MVAFDEINLKFNGGIIKSYTVRFMTILNVVGLSAINTLGLKNKRNAIVFKSFFGKKEKGLIAPRAIIFCQKGHHGNIDNGNCDK